MTKLSAKQKKERAELAGELTEKGDALKAAITAFNDATTEAWASVETARDEYNTAVENAKEFVEGITGAIEDYVGERSEKWHEGEKAAALESWKEEWEGLELEAVEMEQPEGPDDFNEELADALEAVADGAD